MPFISSVRGNFGAIGRGSRRRVVDIAPLVAGGTVTTAGGYRIHSFTGPGTLSIDPSIPTPLDVEYLVIAGGGQGGPWAGGAPACRTCPGSSRARSARAPGW